MLYATNRFPGDGVTTQYEISFVGGYLQRSHVKAYVENMTTRIRTPVTVSPGQFLNATTLTGFAPVPVGSMLVIYRETPRASLLDFTTTSRITEANLDLSARQGLYCAAEALDFNYDLVQASNEIAGIADLVQAGVAQTAANVVLTNADVVTTNNHRLAAAGSATASANSATASANSATASANSATASAGSATASAGSATASAGSATAALGSKAAAATSATNSGNSATQSANSATAAANSSTTATTAKDSAVSAATTAGTQATAANTSAGQAAGYAATAQSSQTAAANSATAAAASATAAAASASNPDKIMACRFEYVNSSQCRLAGFGGNTVVIGGVARALPAGGATLALNGGWALDTIQYVYAYWTGTAVAIYASTVVPQMNTTYGYQTQNADPNTTLVGAFARRAAGFVDNLLDRNVVSLYNQPARVFSASLGSALNVANGGSTMVLNATLVVLGGSVDFNGGGQVSCTGYARTLPRINGFNVNGAATMQGNASVALGYIVARNCSPVGVGVIIPSVALAAISAAAMAVGGEEAGWHLMGVHHP